MRSTGLCCWPVLLGVILLQTGRACLIGGLEPLLCSGRSSNGDGRGCRAGSCCASGHRRCAPGAPGRWVGGAGSRGGPAGRGAACAARGAGRHGELLSSPALPACARGGLASARLALLPAAVPDGRPVLPARTQRLLTPGQRDTAVQCFALRVLSDFSLMYQNCVGVLLKRDTDLATKKVRRPGSPA